MKLRQFIITCVTTLLFIGLFTLTASAQYPEVSIYEIQSSLEDGTDMSTFAGDTVIVTGTVTAMSGLFYAGNHVTYYIQDPNYDTYAGAMVYADATSDIDAVVQGMQIRLPVWVDEYAYDDISMTELRIPTWATYESVGFETLEPTDIACADIDTALGMIHGEPYEGMLIRVHDLEYVDDQVFPSSGGYISQWGLECETGEVLWVRIASDSLPTDQPYTLAMGTEFNSVTGVIYHRFNNYFIQPRYYDDLDFVGMSVGDPAISPDFPTPDDFINISCVVSGPPDISAETATLYYRADENDPWTTMNMAAGINNSYSALLNPFSDGTTVDLYIEVETSEGDFIYSPEDAPNSYHSFSVMVPPTVSVYEIQHTETPGSYGEYPSDINGSFVTVEGVVMTTYGPQIGYGYYINDINAPVGEPWHGVFVYDSGGTLPPPNVGDHVAVTGLVDEYNGVTELNTSYSTAPNAQFEVLGTADVPGPISVDTDDVPFDNPDVSEPYEGVFVRFQDVYISELTDFDFMISEDPGADEKALVSRFNLVTPEDEFTLEDGALIDAIQGYVHYTYGEYILWLGEVVSLGIEDEVNLIPQKFALHQNYPNPFNPSTAIAFSLPLTSQVSLKVYNVNGQLVKTLANDEKYEVGDHQLNWDGTNSMGDEVGSGIYFYKLKTDSFNDSKRMVLMK